MKCHTKKYQPFQSHTKYFMKIFREMGSRKKVA